jgi:hypothetical protein
MNDYQIIRKYKKTETWIGAVVLGLVCLIISFFAPIDGEPGYKLITPQDFSIIFGFAFAVMVGASVGAIGGATLGRRYGQKKVTQPQPSPTLASPVSATPRTAPVAANDHPLLDLLLSNMPLDTSQKVSGAFAPVASNFEFYTWIPLSQTQSIADEANRRGFTIWGNTDATGAILYGAGKVSEDQAASVIVWLRAVSPPRAPPPPIAFFSQPDRSPTSHRPAFRDRDQSCGSRFVIFVSTDYAPYSSQSCTATPDNSSPPARVHTIGTRAGTSLAGNPRHRSYRATCATRTRRFPRYAAPPIPQSPVSP